MQQKLTQYDNDSPATRLDQSIVQAQDCLPLRHQRLIAVRLMQAQPLLELQREILAPDPAQRYLLPDQPRIVTFLHTCHLVYF